MIYSSLPPDCNWITTKYVVFDSIFSQFSVSLEPQFESICRSIVQIPGLREALAIPHGNVTSIYSPKYVNRHLQALEQFEKGNVVFTFPASPVKCPGAPQKICYITEHYLRRVNKRQNAKIIYNTALPVLFAVKRYADALWIVVKERDIQVNLKTNLVEVQPEKNIAIFASVDAPNERHSVEVSCWVFTVYVAIKTFIHFLNLRLQYAILHATPPQSAVSALLKAKDLVNDAGFVNVDQFTMQHVKYPNVFALGDCTSTPNSKTMAAIGEWNQFNFVHSWIKLVFCFFFRLFRIYRAVSAGQVGVLETNMKSFLNGKPLAAKYNGYASCPLVTGYDSCILAEFDYNLEPLETFPFRQNAERYSMFVLKRDVMPMLYWKFMLKGRWNGPNTFRKIFNIFKRN